MPTFLDVDLGTLFLPTQRLAGADPWKLQQQIVKHGHSTLGMPAIWVEADPDGACKLSMLLRGRQSCEAVARHKRYPIADIKDSPGRRGARIS